MKKIMVLLALGAVGAGFAAWAAPAPRKPVEQARRGTSPVPGQRG